MQPSVLFEDFALGRKSWLFAGSERGANRAAAMTTLIMTAKSTASIRRHGWPMCSAKSPTSRGARLPNYCLELEATEFASGRQ